MQFDSILWLFHPLNISIGRGILLILWSSNSSADQDKLCEIASLNLQHARKKSKIDKCKLKTNMKLNLNILLAYSRHLHRQRSLNVLKWKFYFMLNIVPCVNMALVVTKDQYSGYSLIISFYEDNTIYCYYFLLAWLKEASIDLFLSFLDLMPFTWMLWQMHFSL